MTKVGTFTLVHERTTAYSILSRILTRASQSISCSESGTSCAGDKRTPVLRFCSAGFLSHLRTTSEPQTAFYTPTAAKNGDRLRFGLEDVISITRPGGFVSTFENRRLDRPPRNLRGFQWIPHVRQRTSGRAIKCCVGKRSQALVRKVSKFKFRSVMDYGSCVPAELCTYARELCTYGGESSCGFSTACRTHMTYVIPEVVFKAHDFEVSPWTSYIVADSP